MKVGDLVEIAQDDEEDIRGTIVEIVLRIEDDDGELWEVPLNEVIAPELEDQGSTT